MFMLVSPLLQRSFSLSVTWTVSLLSCCSFFASFFIALNLLSSLLGPFTACLCPNPYLKAGIKSQLPHPQMPVLISQLLNIMSKQLCASTSSLGKDSHAYSKAMSWFSFKFLFLKEAFLLKLYFVTIP